VAIDQHEIDGIEPGKQFGKRRLGRAAVLGHQRPAPGGGDDHLPRAGLPVAVAVAARLVDVEIPVRMLAGRDREAAAGDFGHQPLDEGGLAGILPAGDAEDPHRAAPARSSCARSRSSGVLTLKKGNSPSNTAFAQPIGSVQTITLRCPSASAARRSSRSDTDQRPKVGWRERPRSGSGVIAMAIGFPSRSMTSWRSATSVSGKKGVSPAADARSSYPCAAAQSMPARMPASGPANPAMLSGTTGRPK